jgi:hypothetical protein
MKFKVTVATIQMKTYIVDCDTEEQVEENIQWNTPIDVSDYGNPTLHIEKDDGQRPPYTEK